MLVTISKNRNYCNGCKHWVHTKCNGIQWLTPNPDYRCAWCKWTAGPFDGRPQSDVLVEASFCYLGKMLSAGGGCELAVTTRVKTTWKKFRELLPVLTSPPPVLQDPWPCIELLLSKCHALGCWSRWTFSPYITMKAMIRHISNIKPKDVATVRSRELLAYECI